jgi:hypothetical protein
VELDHASTGPQFRTIYFQIIEAAEWMAGLTRWLGGRGRIRRA